MGQPLSHGIIGIIFASPAEGPFPLCTFSSLQPHPAAGESAGFQHTAQKPTHHPKNIHHISQPSCVLLLSWSGWAGKPAVTFPQQETSSPAFKKPQAAHKNSHPC